MAESINGWRRDPFGGHEFRYFSNDGRATRLVSDGGVRSYDAGSGTGAPSARPTQFAQARPVHAGAPALSVVAEPQPTSEGPTPPTRSGPQRRRRPVAARVANSARTFYRSGWRKPVIGVVICGLLALGGEIATASTSNGPLTSTTLQQGVYVSAADPSGVASFAAATQTDPTIASDYLPSTTGWDGMDGSGGFLAWIFPSLAKVASDNTTGWTTSGYTISLGVPMIPTWPDGGQGSGAPAGTLAGGADGEYNNYYVALAENLVNAGEGNAYLRLGWEFDGGWYNWSATNPAAEANFAEYFRQIVTAMRTVPGENFKFVWNPDAEAFVPGGESYDPNYNVALAYPGNAYVDDIGVDAYDQTWVTPQTASTEWNETTFPELTAAAQFAQAQGKPLAIPEWGVAVRDDGHGLGDDPLYTNNMIAWMQNPANDVAYESYFDFDGSSQQDAITDGNFPHSLAAFINDFNGSASPATTPSTTPPSSTTTTTTPPSTTTTTTSPPSTSTTPASTSSFAPDAPSGLNAPSNLVFDDEFNEGSLNTAEWSPYWFSNGETQNGTVMDSSNVSVGANGLGLSLASNNTGGIVSTDPDDHVPGHTGFQIAPTPGNPVYVEFQVTLPADAEGTIANWPAVWLDGQNWPEDGEIDVMEGLGGWAAYHLHFGSSGEGADAVGAAVNSTPGTHTYGILWTTTGVTFIYDGQQEQTLNESLTSPEYLLMENSLGSGPHQIPSTVQVRYVRVWQ